jgi:hypothetical protein
LVFLSEGIQKFLFPGTLGAERFEKIGIPAQRITGPFVAVVEVVLGSAVLLGLPNSPLRSTTPRRHSDRDCNKQLAMLPKVGFGAVTIAPAPIIPC